MINKVLVIISVVLVIVLIGLGLMVMNRKQITSMIPVIPGVQNQTLVYVPTNNPQPTTYVPKGIGDNDYTILIRNNTIVSGDVIARKGTPIVWKNETGEPVKVVFTSGNESHDLQQGGTFNKVFTISGLYSYFLSSNPAVKGTITIRD